MSILQNRDYTAFNPGVYLQEYYASIPAENLELLRFLVHAFKDVKSGSLVLDFGGGPTLYTVIPAAAQVERIHFSDYLKANRDEVKKWLHQEVDAFDWDKTIQAVLELEGKDSSLPAVAHREAEIRKRVERVLACDATSLHPLGRIKEKYDVIVSNLCLEAAAQDYPQWRQCIRNVTSLLKPQGRLIMTTVKAGYAYPVGSTLFPVVNLREEDVMDALVEVGFKPQNIHITWTPADHPVYRYDGLMFITASAFNRDDARVRDTQLAPMPEITRRKS